MEERKIAKRITILMAAVVLVGALFVTDLFRIQVIHHEDYNTIKSAVRADDTTVEAARGEILDRNGIPIVTNKIVNTVVFDASYFPGTREQEQRNEIIYALIQLFEQEGAVWNDNLPLYFDKDGKIQFTENSEKEIDFLKSRDVLYLNDYATAQNCFDALIEKFGLQSYGREDARKIASVCYSFKKVSFSLYSPFTFASDISTELAAKIKEKSGTLRGVDIVVKTVRDYPDGTLAPHLLGTVGALDAEEYQKRREEFKAQYEKNNLSEEERKTLNLRAYGMNDFIGKFGIEKEFEQYLRGTNGIKTVSTDTDGNKTSLVTRAPVQGDTVQLTLSAELQKATQAALEKRVREVSAKKPLPVAGAAVVIDVHTGEVLACATYPSYDISNYYTDYTALSKDKNSPLWNRALQSAYAPGSTFKPAMALAGLEEGVITETSEFNCTRIYNYKGHPFKCLHNHGNENVKEALRDSCNIFFYETGRQLGIERMNDYCKRLGLGQKTGIELPESAGVLASIEYREAHGGTWYPGDTVQAAIGQSDNLFTPIQLCNYAATIANGGTRYKTHLIKSIKSSDYKTTVLQKDAEVAMQTGISAKNIAIAKEGMGLVGDKTGLFKQFDFRIAAKTGTAESKGKVNGKIVAGLNAFMISFAPFDNPEIAVAVMIENLESGSQTAPLVADIYNAYFHPQGTLTEAPGYNNLLG